MSDFWFILALVASALLVLIPVGILVGYLGRWIVGGYLDARRAEARRVTRAIPGLGDFTSTDGALWFGKVRDLQVTLESPNGPPTEAQAERVLALLGDLPALVEEARAYLVEHEDTSWLGGERAFEPFGLQLEEGDDCVLELIHPGDADAVYRVEFRGRVPMSCGRDD